MKNMQNNAEIKFEKINEQYYSDFLTICETKIFAPLLLPQKFSSDLWGIIALQDRKVIGGLVGLIRGNKPLIKHFTKGVWFDSYPIFSDEYDNLESAKSLIDFAKQQAKKDKIILFNFTRWVRQTEGIEFDIPEKNATFLFDLSKDMETLIKGVSKSQMRTIRKAERNNVEIMILQQDDCLKYLDDFQRIRRETQKRAIAENADSSILLKSNQFIIDILKNPNSYFFIAKHEGKVASIALFLQCGKTLYGYLGGSDIDINRATGASSFLYWKIIEFAKEQGLLFFDFGGSPVSPKENNPAYQVFLFKKSFGCEYHEYNSGKIIISPMKYKLLNFVLKNRKLLRFISRNEK